MRKTFLIFIALALLAISSGCTPRPTPTVASATSSEIIHQIEVVFSREAGAGSSFTQSRAFQVGQTWFYNDSVGTWPDNDSPQQERFKGLVRYALARWVTDLQQPQPQPGETPEWVLLTSLELDGSALSWRETLMKPRANGSFDSGTSELPISQTLSFDAGSSTQEGFDNLLTLRDDQEQPGRGLWVEVLVAEIEGPDGTVWATHMFSEPTSDPGDQDEKRTVCCDQLRCDRSRGWWVGWCWVHSCSTLSCSQ